MLSLYHCTLSLLKIAGQQDTYISLDSECPKQCHRTTYSYITVFSFETGNNLTVLSELGHLCLVFLLQSMHWGNFAAFVTLLQK